MLSFRCVHGSAASTSGRGELVAPNRHAASRTRARAPSVALQALAPTRQAVASPARAATTKLPVVGALAPPPAGARSVATDASASSTQLHQRSVKWDILGLGQAMVDYAAAVNPQFLAEFQLPSGGRRVVTVDERAAVMEALEEAGCESQVSPGGSLANTLVAVARLARTSQRGLKMAIAGSMGTDTLGEYFNASLEDTGVSVLLDESSAHTGTVIALTTPDAQRSFLSFFTSGDMQLTSAVSTAIASSRMLVIEGYLWETPNALQYIRAAAALARDAGAQVVLTAGDPGVVTRHRASMLTVIADGVDMLFCNSEEAINLLHGGVQGVMGSEAGVEGAARTGVPHTGVEAALQLGTMCAVAVVTDGPKGAYIAAMGELHVVPPHWNPHGPLDTCGAGDAFAAGVLYGMLCGFGMHTSARFASRVASSVISRFGPHLSTEDAAMLVSALPSHSPLPMPAAAPETLVAMLAGSAARDDAASAMAVAVPVAAAFYAVACVAMAPACVVPAAAAAGAAAGAAAADAGPSPALHGLDWVRNSLESLVSYSSLGSMDEAYVAAAEAYGF